MHKCAKNAIDVNLSYGVSSPVLISRSEARKIQEQGTQIWRSQSQSLDTKNMICYCYLVTFRRLSTWINCHRGCPKLVAPALHGPGRYSLKRCPRTHWDRGQPFYPLDIPDFLPKISQPPHCVTPICWTYYRRHSVFCIS